jgi:hypothetical protein
MPKPAKDLRLHGVTFEEALRRLVSAPPHPKSKKAKREKAIKNQLAKN